MKYTLDEHGQPQVEPDLMKWSFWLRYADRVVAKTQIEDAEVSTVFLGFDHGFGSKIILWETMVFGGFFDGHQWRCGGGREQAEAQHAEVVAWLGKEAILDLPKTEDEDDG